MGQEYSDPTRESDETALPDLEIFELTATEVAEMDEELVWQYSREHEFRLCSFNSRVRDAMLDRMIEENNIKGGWFYWYCFPGCLPDSPAIGPFSSYESAKIDAREQRQLGEV